MSADRLTRALQDYLGAEQYVTTERSHIDAATRERAAAKLELEGALQAETASLKHPLAATVREVLAGKADLTQVSQKLKERPSQPRAGVAGQPLIVIAVDDSDQALWAVTAGGKLAQRIGAHVLLVHVLVPTEAFAPESYAPPSEYIEMRKNAEAVLQTARELLPAGVEATTILEDGDAATTLALLAQERSADFIFIGTHGRGRIGQLLMGSTATKVARLAKCPVVVVSHQPEELGAQSNRKQKLTERLLEKLNPVEVPLD